MNFIVTIHKLRPRGMTWFRLPLFAWGLYATALIQILATPVLAITLLLLIAERLFHPGIFDPAYGGDAVLFQHFFWFYSHPAVYIMILPGMGIMSEIIATFARREIFGYRFVAMSSIAIALIGFLVWGHHMFPNGQSGPANTVFSALTVLVAIPSAIKVFNWLATLYKGSIVLKSPMLYALGFFFMFAIGGLTGLPLAILPTNFNVHDTYFVVAHFHYVMFGGTLFMFIGGLHYWWPKITGRMYNEAAGTALLPAGDPGLQPHLFPAIHPRPARHAAALCGLLSRVPVPARHVVDRGVHPACGVPADRGVPAALALPRQAGPGQSLGRLDAGMDLLLAAAARQFPRGPRGRPPLRPSRAGLERGYRRVRAEARGVGADNTYVLVTGRRPEQAQRGSGTTRRTWKLPELRKLVPAYTYKSDPCPKR